MIFFTCLFCQNVTHKIIAEFLPRRDLLPHPEPGAAAAGEAGGQHRGGRGAVPAGQIIVLSLSSTANNVKI